LSILQDIRWRNGDAWESNSRVVGVNSLKVTMYNFYTNAGANQAINYIVFKLDHKIIAFTVNLENLCWFGWMSYLKFQKVPGEYRNIHKKYTH
jgi:hypothetical protein